MQTKQIFIVGNSRSGTTMMGRILNNHSNIFTFNEIHFFGKLWVRDDMNKKLEENQSLDLMSKLLCIQANGLFHKEDYLDYNNQSKQLLNNNTTITSLEIFRLFLDHITSSNRKVIACEQTPRNVFYIQEILEAFPKAKIINMVRDPRDVLLSQKKKWKRRNYGAKSIPVQEAIRSFFNYHPYIISKLWNSSILQYSKQKKNKRVFNIYFEEFLLDPKNNILKICEFLEVDFEDRMELIPHLGSSIKNDDHNSLGVDINKIAQWKKGGLNSSEIFLCQMVCRKMMKHHNYKLKRFGFPPLQFILYFISLPINVFFAFILNFHRIRNIREVFMKRILNK